MKSFPLRLLAGSFLFSLTSLTLVSPAWASSSNELPWFFAGFFILFFCAIFLFYCAIFLFVAAFYVLLILALVDIARAQNEGNWKLMWALISLFAGLIGIAVYYFVGRRERIPPKQKEVHV